MVEIQYFALFTLLGVNFCGIYYSCDKLTPLEVHELKKTFDGIWTKVRNCRKLQAWRQGGGEAASKNDRGAVVSFGG